MAKKSLPKAVTYDDGAQRYRVEYKDSEGRWRVEHAGTNKQAAVRLLARRKREAAKGVQVNRDASPTYTRDEALALLMDPRIGWDRRVVYALQFFTGM